MKRRFSTSALLLASAVTLSSGTALASPRALGYDLPADGVLLEGIGYDEARDTIYVSGVNDGGRIYRGRIGVEQLEVWLPGGVDGRTTARGIDTDDLGRVYIAGGPTGRLWVVSPDGITLASLETTAGTFLNDVWVAPDGAAYVTDSSQPKIWRVAQDPGGAWGITLWLDATGTIDVVIPGFNLGGIVATPDGRYLLVSQGTTGRLWRIDLATRDVVPVDLGGATIVNADGIVLLGHRLYVVQNFLRRVTELRLSGDWAAATVESVTATPADRTFTTAKFADGRLLLVDSRFGLPAPHTAQDRVVEMKLP